MLCCENKSSNNCRFTKNVKLPEMKIMLSLVTRNIVRQNKKCNIIIKDKQREEKSLLR